MDDLISRQAAIDALETQERQYTFGNNEFSLEAAYHDCKMVFDGITDDDSFQEADTGLILYYANEIIYALHEALEGKDTNVISNDYISRQAAIDALCHVDEYIARIVEAIRNLPSAQPEQRWIPCSEKLLEPCDTKTENVLNSNWTIYSDRVKTELETQGITTRELADKLNITPITMHRYLKGDRIPRGPVIAQTATVLNVTCDYLVGLSDDPHKTSEEK